MTDSPLDVISSTKYTSVTADTMHGKADDQRLDQWELKAARRALQNLKILLYETPMLDLLRGQIEEGDRRLKQYLAASKGEYTQTQVIVRGTNVTTEQMLANYRLVLGGVMTPEKKREVAFNMAFPMHPEHYAIPPYTGIVETMGGIPTRSRVMRAEETPSFIAPFIDESYPMRLVGKAEIDDGTTYMYVLQQFKDTDAGLEANLRIWYPAACPPIYLEEHAEHYAVEFRNSLRIMAAATK
jgi:hypothetical protein